MGMFSDQVQDQNLELHVSLLIKKFITDDKELHKRLPSVLKALNGKEDSEKNLIEKLLRLSFNWEAFKKMGVGKTVTVKELIQGDPETVSLMNAMNIGIGSKNVPPYPWFIRMQNVLLKLKGNIK